MSNTPGNSNHITPNGTKKVPFNLKGEDNSDFFDSFILPVRFSDSVKQLPEGANTSKPVEVARKAKSPSLEQLNLVERFIQNKENLKSPLEKYNAHLGMGCSPLGVPIDVITLLFAGESFGNFDIMLADSFHRLNGVPQNEVEEGLHLFESTLEKIKSVFGLTFSTHRASETFAMYEFQSFAESLRSDLLKNHNQKLKDCIPESKKHLPEAIDYPLFEIAMTCYLGETKGVNLKLGPSRERLYDALSHLINPRIDYAYAIDALPAALSNPKPVVHYVPTDCGGSGGVRICFFEKPEKLEVKLNQINAFSMDYFIKLVSTAATLLDIKVELPNPGSVFDRRVKRQLIHGIKKAILEPLGNG